MPFAISVTTTFSAAHALRLPDGTFEPVHGHDWRVDVTVASDGLDAMETVMDFHVLQAALEAIVKPWRNQDLNRCDPFAGPSPALPKINPSAERVAKHVGDSIATGLPDGVRLESVAVKESPGCVALYRPAATA
ncbi:MAG: 6-carboxytetrahydropterin synthase [Planctomycetota bacterium]